MKYKDLKRKKFTERQLSILEKCHWLSCRIRSKRGIHSLEQELEETETLNKLLAIAERFISS